MKDKQELADLIKSSKISKNDLFSIIDEVYSKSEKQIVCDACSGTCNVNHYNLKGITIAACNSCPCNVAILNLIVKAKKQKQFNYWDDREKGLFLRGTLENGGEIFIHFECSAFETFEIRSKDQVEIRIPFFNAASVVKGFKGYGANLNLFIKRIPALRELSRQNKYSEMSDREFITECFIEDYWYENENNTTKQNRQCEKLVQKIKNLSKENFYYLLSILEPQKIVFAYKLIKVTNLSINITYNLEASALIQTKIEDDIMECLQ